MAGELVTLSGEKYPALAGGGGVADMLAENLGGETIGVGELDRIKVPSGGGTLWTVQTIDGEQAMRAVEGVIVHATRRRAYFGDRQPKPGTLPLCSSRDMATGEPHDDFDAPEGWTGDCDVCPLNEFGSGKRSDGSASKGKACKESRLLFMLREGDALPVIVQVPPGSLKPIKTYLVQLAKAGLPYHAVVTSLSLVKVSGAGVPDFAQIAPRMSGRLDSATCEKVRVFADGMRALLERQTVAADRE